jgi:hypothetical protein
MKRTLNIHVVRDLQVQPRVYAPGLLINIALYIYVIVPAHLNIHCTAYLLGEQ